MTTLPCWAARSGSTACGTASTAFSFSTGVGKSPDRSGDSQGAPALTAAYLCVVGPVTPTGSGPDRLGCPHGLGSAHGKRTHHSGSVEAPVLLHESPRPPCVAQGTFRGYGRTSGILYYVTVR